MILKGLDYLAKILALACFGLVLTACTSFEGGGSAAFGPHAYPVDTIFREFYQALGGETVLGLAISGVELHEDALQCQFTERALLCLNPNVSDSSRYSLHPLGLDLGIQPDIYVDWSTSGADERVVDGIPIYEKFVPLYDQLYGAQYVGRPLTALRINPDLQRAEQFFENVGFYQELGSTDNPVHLIPYGAYLCRGACSSRLDEYWAIVKSSTVDQPFAGQVARLGGPAVFGPLLLKAQVAADGSLEQVYTNAAFYSPAGIPEQVRLRPLPLLLGYEIQALTGPMSHEMLVFYEIEGGLGHNVLRFFDEFIALHGGRDLSGRPLTEVMRLPGPELYQQCFENYCLLYEPAAPAALKVRMAALGKEYNERFPAPAEARIEDLFSAERITLVVSADRPTLGTGEEQVIRMAVQQRETGQPLARVEGTLVLNFTDRPAIRATFPPTGDDGLTSVTIPTQPGLANGARLWYEACLNLPSQRPICQVDSYLIWDTGQQ